MEIIRLTDEKTGVRIYEARYPDGRVLQGPSVSEATNHINRRELINWFKKTGLEEQEEIGGGAAAIGTAIHEILDRVAKTGSVGEVPENIRPALRQYEEFAKKYSLNSESSEKYIFSETYRYGGTYDQIGFINGKRNLIDFKTGRFNNKDLWKTEAYRRAYIEMGGDKEIGTTLVYLDKEGKIAPKTYTIEHHDFCFVSFLSCLFLWKGLYFNDLKRAGWDVQWLIENPVEKFLEKCLTARKKERRI